MLSVTSVLLVTKTAHKQAADTAERMAAWFVAQGVACSVIAADAAPGLLRDAASAVDAVLVLGGDGTFLGVCRTLIGQEKPLLGVNFGQVGFLTEVSATDWEPTCTRLLQGTLQIVPRMALHWTAWRGGEVLDQGYAVNDVVVSRGTLARVLPVHVAVSDEVLGWLRGDGVIVSSPLGSSAYGLSAHGSLVHPDLQALSLTPISPFFNSFPPMILPAHSRVVLTIGSGSLDAFVTIDGQQGIALEAKDAVSVVCVERGVCLVDTAISGYFERLRNKGFVQSLLDEKSATAVRSDYGRTAAD